MTLPRTSRWTDSFAFDLLVGIVPALILLALNLLLALIMAAFVAYGLSFTTLSEVLENTLDFVGVLGFFALFITEALACMALIGALIVRHRAGGLAQLPEKWRGILGIFLTFGIVLPALAFWSFSFNPFALRIGQDAVESLGLSGLLLFNVYAFPFPAVMSYRTLGLLKTAGGST